MQLLKNTRKTHYAFLLIILVLSAYVHLWNPVGFPDIFFDEGIYMRRAMNVLETGNPQEGYFYDHPYLGQIILAGVLKITGFPQSVEQSLDLSYMVPRLFIGIIAVLDTFLVFKIAGKKFNNKIALLAAILFAVMPITWLLRRILLDTILLPLVLLSILLALYSENAQRKNLLIFASSIFLGLAIFTKITAITMIPVVAYVIFSNHQSKKYRISWFAPIFLIPMIWPAVSIGLGQFDLWLKDILWQSSRSTGDFLTVTGYIFSIDPVFIALGFVSFVFASIKKKWFLVLWFAPFLLFVSNVGFLQYFHFVLLLPVFCIAAAFMMYDIFKNTKMCNYILVGIGTGLLVYGTGVSSILINTDVSSAQITALEFALENFDDSNSTLLASPVYSWIFNFVYDKNNVFPDYSVILFESIKTKDMMLIADPHFMLDIQRGIELQNAYDDSHLIYEINGSINQINTNIFPFQSMMLTGEGKFIEVKRTSMP